MSNASDAVGEFGRTIGLDDLHLGHSSACELRWADGSALVLEETDEHLLVCVMFPTPHLQPQEKLKALEMQDMRVYADMPAVQVGVRDQGEHACLVALSRLDARSASGREIQQAVDLITRWRHRWEAACGRGDR